MTAPESTRLAHVALSRVVEPGSVPLWEALQEHGPEEVWHRLQAGALLSGLGQQALEGLAGRVSGYDPRRDLTRVDQIGARVVVPGDPEWPTASLTWHPSVMGGDVKQQAPPHVLYVLGASELIGSTARSVSVVGARACSSYGVRLATELGLGLSEAGWGVVSGGAYGIDAAAHRGALEGQAAPTIAVLACGLDVAYPRGNGPLLADVARSGLLVSEHPPGASVTRLRFLVRNRLIAALSRGTVLVEAAHRSGSLSTAGRACDLLRHVMAVPGPVTSEVSAGCHSWIRDGKAVLVTGTADVLELVGDMGEHVPARPRGRADPRDGLDEQARRVLEAVPVRTAVGIGSIGRTAGVSPLVVQQVLPQLLVRGLVEQRDGTWRLSPLASG